MIAKWIVSGISVLGLLVCFAADGSAGVKKRESESVLDSPEAHYKQAMDKLNAGKLEEALEEFQQTLGLDPDHAGAYVGFALLRARQGQYDDALRYIKTARKKARKWPDVYIAKGQVLVLRGKKNWLKDALKAYKEARKLDADDDRVAFHEGEAYRKAAKYDEAEAAYRKCIEAKGPTQGRAERAFNQVQLIKKAEPFSEVGIRVAKMDPATRADLCALLIDEMKLEELVEKHVEKTYDTGFRPPGADVEQVGETAPGDLADHWAKSWVERVLALEVPGLGIYPDATFRPSEPVTRKDLAMVIQGLLVLIKRDPSLTTKFLGADSQFKDVRADVYYFNAATLAVNQGLMQVGKREATFRPEEEVSGAEAVLALKDLKDALVTR